MDGVKKDAQVSVVDIAAPQYQQISCRNTRAVINFINEQQGMALVRKAFAGILDPNTLTATHYCYRGKPLDLEFFLQVENWYPYAINRQLFDNLQALNIDAFRFGYDSVRHAAKINNLAVTGLMHGFGPVGVIRKASEILELFNRTKKLSIESHEDNLAIVRVDYAPGIRHSAYVTRQNIGAYVAGLELTGAQQVKVKILEDVFSETGGYTRLEFCWQRENLWQRLRWIGGMLISNLLARNYLKSHHPIQRYHADLVEGLQREIEAKERAQQESIAHYQALVETLENKESQLQVKVQEKTVELQQALAQKEQMFANFAHEVQTPLMLVLNPLRRVRQLLRDERCQQLLATAEVNLEDLQTLIRQLLTLESRKVEKVRPGRSHLMQIVHEVADSVRFALSEHCLQLNLSVDDKLQCLVAGEYLKQVLTNLLENAIKYCRPGDAIYLSASPCQSGQTQIIIEDSRPGIAPEHQQKIFERFYRAPGVENIRGSGMGLAIVKQLVESQGGQIICTTSPQGGARFEITLPCATANCDATESDEQYAEEIKWQADTHVAEPEAEPVTDTAPAEKTKPEQKPLILIAEDNQQLRRYLVSTLQDDYRCLEVEDGEQAWQYLLSGAPDLVLSDVMMPKVDGYQLTRRIKMHVQTCHIPVVLLTAKSDWQSELNGLQVEADEYLTKPIRDELLLQKIANLLTQQQRLFKYTRHQLEQGQKVNELLNLPHEKFKTDLDAYLEKHFDEENLYIGDIAKAMAMSERKLQMVCKKALGMTPVQYRKLYRINKAKEMMAMHPDWTKTRIATECGFSNVSMLCKALKESGLRVGV